MAKKVNATEQHRVAVARLVLEGLARDEPLADETIASVRRLPVPFPGDVLTEIGATALEVAGATRRHHCR